MKYLHVLIVHYITEFLCKRGVYLCSVTFDCLFIYTMYVYLSIYILGKRVGIIVLLYYGVVIAH